MLNRICALSLFAFCCLSTVHAQVVIKTGTKDGEVVSGNFTLSVTVDSQSLVSQVEFYIDDNLVSTDESTPYEFTIDTLTRDDGPLTISVAAYSRSGESAKLNVKLKVDNGLARGAAYHVEQAESFASNQQWSKAIYEARVALKIEPKNNSARMVMARAYYGSGRYDMAQKFAEDVTKDVPGDIMAHELLSAIGLKQAFYAMQYGAGDDRTIETIKNTLRASAKSKNESFSRQIDALAATKNDNDFRYVDILASSGRFSIVIDELNARLNKDERNTAVADRLVYALIMAGRYKEAQSTLRRHSRATTPDGYGYALTAILEDWYGNEDASLTAEQQALLSDPSSAGVQSAQAFLALRRGRIRAVESVVRRLAVANVYHPVTNYYLSALHFIQSKYDLSQTAFQTALLGDPSMYHVYLERFNQAIAFYVKSNSSGGDVKYQLKFARAFAEGALEAKPESFEALTALAIVHLYEGNAEEAIKLAQAAVTACPQYSAAHYTLATAYFENKMLDRGMRTLGDAGKLDKSRLSGISAPTVDDAWRYYYLRGRTPLLVPPGA